MSNGRFVIKNAYPFDRGEYIFDSTQNKFFIEIEEIIKLLNSFDVEMKKLQEENEQLHHKLKQTKEYLQIKIDECKNPKKMKEIVFGVEQAVGYEKALLQFQKGLKRRLNDE